MSDPPVAVYVSVESSLSSAEACIHLLERSDRDAVLFVEPDILTSAREMFPDARPLPGSRRIDALSRLQGLTIQSLTSLTPGDNARNRTAFAPTGRAARITHRLLDRLPKVAPRTLNRWATKTTGGVVPDVFGVREVYAITPVDTPVVLNRRGLRVSAVLDSWDQPVRRTAGFTADRVLAWNRDLAEDWVRIQGGSDIDTIDAYRLQYALQSRRRRGTWTPSENDVVLYPMATTPNRDSWYRAELRLVEALCEATEGTGRTLLVKPKPNSGPGDLEQLVSRFDHVVVGEYLGTEATPDWRITDAYNEVRLAELDRSSCVISTVTTFALDAATAGVPVLQLDLRDVRELGALADAANNAHLVQHLYPRSSASLFRPGSLDELRSIVADLDRLEPQMRAASDELATWLWDDRLATSQARLRT